MLRKENEFHSIRAGLVFPQVFLSQILWQDIPSFIYQILKSSFTRPPIIFFDLHDIHFPFGLLLKISFGM